MDGGSDGPIGWRSSIPGVHQRDGAPAALGLTGRGMRGPSMGEAGVRHDDGDPTAGPAGDRRSSGRGRGWSVPWRAIGLAMVALVAIVGVARAAGIDAGVAARTGGSGDGAAVTGDPVRSPSPASLTPGAAEQVAGSQEPESPDWWAVLAELDARRVRTLTQLAPALLPTYAQAGSRAWEEDAALLADLTGRGLRPQGLASRVLAVERVTHDGAQARLQVVDERTGYSLADSTGAVVAQVEPAGPRRWAITLSRLPGGPQGGDPPGQPSERDPGWRVVAVAPVGSGESGDIEGGVEASSGAADAPAGGAPAGGAPIGGAP